MSLTSDIHMLLNSDETTIPHDLLSQLTKRMLLYSNSHDILSDLSLDNKYWHRRGELTLSRTKRESKGVFGSPVTLSHLRQAEFS
jgi:hypothetical protein